MTRPVVIDINSHVWRSGGAQIACCPRYDNTPPLPLSHTSRLTTPNSTSTVENTRHFCSAPGPVPSDWQPWQRRHCANTLTARGRATTAAAGPVQRVDLSPRPSHSRRPAGIAAGGTTRHCAALAMGPRSPDSTWPLGRCTRTRTNCGNSAVVEVRNIQDQESKQCSPPSHHYSTASTAKTEWVEDALISPEANRVRGSTRSTCSRR